MIPKTEVGMSNAKFRKDLEDSVELLNYIQRLVVYDAKITKVEAGVYECEVYGSGPGSATIYEGVKTYSLYNREFYELNQPIQINILPDQTALIIRDTLPPGQGRYKVLQILTEGNPGMPGYDYWRFPPPGTLLDR